MEMTKQGLTDMIGRSEDVIKKLFSSTSDRQVKILEECAWYIDVGFINCNSPNWAMLLYYPSPEISMTMGVSDLLWLGGLGHFDSYFY